MLLVGLLALVIWGIGAALGTERRLRWRMIGGLYVLVLLEQLLLPDGHALREATGSSPALWFLLGGFASLTLLYSYGIRWLKARSGQAGPGEEMQMDHPVRSETFTASELERYARHIVLREIGGPGQKKLKQAKVLVIGAGGLGSPALLYLAAAGVGTIGVIDDDTVDNSNLQRQVLHDFTDVDRPKVFSAADAMVAQNPNVLVKPYHRRLTEDDAVELFSDYDLVLDGTDNFDTRYLVNRAAVVAGVPLVSGALSQWEGQISVFDPARDAPCYECVFPEAPTSGLAPSCAEAGVLGPLPGVIGTMMATEAIKLISGAGESLRGRLLIYDALYGETRQIALKRRPDCPVCGA